MTVQGPEGCPCQFDYDDDGRLWRITDEACPWHGIWVRLDASGETDVSSDLAAYLGEVANRW